MFSGPWFRDEHVFAAVIGVLSHLCFYRHGEHHMQAPVLFWLHVGAFIGLFYSKFLYKDASQGSFDTISIFATYLCALSGSIVTYRKFFHRLRKFPGPAMASVSKLWHTVQCYNGQNHLLLDKLHKQYGDFVRTGESASNCLYTNP